jgi:hypothetical protein
MWEEGCNLSCQIHWLIFLRVKSKEKADRLLSRFTQAIGREITVRECERYWKDPSLFRVTLTSPLSTEELSTAVPETLQVCWRIARRWTLVAPQFYEGGHWEFSGSAISQTISIEGLTDIDFQVGTLEQAEHPAISHHDEISH